MLLKMFKDVGRKLLTLCEYPVGGKAYICSLLAALVCIRQEIITYGMTRGSPWIMRGIIAARRASNGMSLLPKVSCSPMI